MFKTTGINYTDKEANFPRIHTFDGDYHQIAALGDKVLQAKFQEVCGNGNSESLDSNNLQIDENHNHMMLVKFPAALSLHLQPNDLMDSFKKLKKNNNAITKEVCEIARTKLEEIDDFKVVAQLLLKYTNIKPGKMNLLQRILTECFTEKIIRKGYDIYFEGSMAENILRKATSTKHTPEELRNIHLVEHQIGERKFYRLKNHEQWLQEVHGHGRVRDSFMDKLNISKHKEINKAVFKDEVRSSLSQRKMNKKLQVSQNEADYTAAQWELLNRYGQNTFVRYLLHHCFKDNSNIEEGIDTDRLPEHRQRAFAMNHAGFKNFNIERLAALATYEELRTNQKLEAQRLKRERLDKLNIIKKMVTERDSNPCFIECRNCSVYHYLKPAVDGNEDEFPRDSPYYTCVDLDDPFLIMHCREKNKNRFYCAKCLISRANKEHWYSQHKKGCKTCKGDSITIENYLIENRDWKSKENR